MQDRENVSVSSRDTSISSPKQLESAVPPYKIATLSSGKFVCMVADDPDCKIELKALHAEIINDHEALKYEQRNYKDIAIIHKLDNVRIQQKYLQVKQDVQDIIHSEIERLLHDPGLAYLVVKK